MLITSSLELRNLTGSFYANNDFTKVKTDIELETEDIVRLIGQPVYDRAINAYQPSTDGEAPGKPKADASDIDKELIQRIQLPIALNAAYRYYQSNLVSHDDTGRKAKLDKDHESMAWEWMLDRDDAAHLRKAQRSTDRLIDWLDAKDIDEWKDSAQKKATRALFVPNTEIFNQQFPIDNSSRFYYIVSPFIRDVQLTHIRKALADDYEPLLSAFQEGSALTKRQEILLHLVQSAMPLLTMAMAVKRYTVQIMPEGVVQGYKSFMQGLNANNIATMPAIQYYSLHLEREAQTALDEIRKYRYAEQPEYNPTQLLPENKPSRKFART